MLEQGPDYEDETRPVLAKAREGGGGHALERASRRSFGEYLKIALTLLILAGLGGVIVWQWPNMASLYRSARAPALTAGPQVAGDSQPTTTRPNKDTARFGQSGDAPATAPATPSQNTV